MADDDDIGFEEATVESGNANSSFYIPHTNTTSTSEGEDISDFTLDKIAARLVKDNLILTALELHTELVESGRELPRLRDYFSNPGNFEKQSHITSETSPVLPRTSSVQTFDSLDFARYSDDGERQVDERVAVLEFELRKARETIKALRANLTVVTESDPNTPVVGVDVVVAQEPVKPHEKRALNFLVNEYLLKNNYKLTSITLSDENEDQDFEDWDDVGLNIPKPPELLQLYRNYCRHLQLWKDVCDNECQTEPGEGSVGDVKLRGHLEIELDTTTLKEQIEKLTQEKEALLLQLKKHERELEFLRNSLKSSTPSVQAQKSKRYCSPEDFSTLSIEDNTQVDFTHPDGLFLPETTRIENEVHEQLPFSDSLNSGVEEHLNDLNASTKFSLPSVHHRPTESSLTNILSSRKLSPGFQKALLNIGYLQKVAQDSRLVNEVAEIVDCNEKVVQMLARCLPHIVPNVLLAKREELIPVILCAISLHPDAKERDKLLNILFNLIKRPDEEHRQMILTGFVAIAQHLGPSRVEAELLPQCWEQITHRYQERRLLVAESCGVLSPYVASEIRSSLILSMLQQMLKEDKEEIVREAATRNLALLLAFVDDPDKFSQATGLLLLALEDRSSSVVEAGLSILLPSIAAWALELDRLEKDLFPTILKSLEEQLKAIGQKSASSGSSPTQVEDQHIVLMIRALYILLLFLLVSVITSGPYVEKIESCSLSPTETDVDRLPVFHSPLLDPAVVFGDSQRLSVLIKAFDRYINEEWYKPWEKCDWLTKTFLPCMLHLLSLVDPQHHTVVHSLVETMHFFCHLFGRVYTQSKVKPPFLNLLRIPEEELDLRIHTEKTSLTDAVIPVYTAGVLTAFHQEDDRQELTSFLQELLCTLSLCHMPLMSLRAAIVELSANTIYHELLLTVLWDGVVHTSALVRATAGRLFELLVGSVSEMLLRTKVTPALVTLASDPEIDVRVATVPAFGAIMEISSQKDLLEKVHLQLQTFLDDPLYRDQHTLQVEIIRTFARVGPNTEPKFRDDFVLPRLAALAAQNNNSTASEMKKKDIALTLLDAYTALSCCFMSDQLIAEAFLPGLWCLRQDLQQLAPEHEETVNSMINEFEAKVDLNRPSEVRSSFSMPPPGSMEDVKNRVSKIFSNRPTANRPNIPNIFQIRKK